MSFDLHLPPLIAYKINLANLSSSIYVVNVEGLSGMKTFKLQTN